MNKDVNVAELLAKHSEEIAVGVTHRSPTWMGENTKIAKEIISDLRECAVVAQSIDMLTEAMQLIDSALKVELGEVVGRGNVHIHYIDCLCSVEYDIDLTSEYEATIVVDETEQIVHINEESVLAKHIVELQDAGVEIQVEVTVESGICLAALSHAVSNILRDKVDDLMLELFE